MVNLTMLPVSCDEECGVISYFGELVGLIQLLLHVRGGSHWSNIFIPLH